MRRYTTLCPLLIAGMLATACTGAEPAPGDDGADRSDIEAGVQRLADAFSAGDADRVVALFAEGGMSLPPNEPARVGKEAVRSWHRAVFDQYSGEADLEPAEIEIRDDLAYVRGTYRMALTAGDGTEVTDRGKFIMIWSRGPDGTWRIARNIWNSDGPVTSS